MLSIMTRSKELEDSGFTNKQSKTLVVVIFDLMESKFATKHQFEMMESSIRSDMKEMENSIRSDMKEMESSIRSDMKEMENSIRSDMKEMESSIRSDMKEMESSIRSDMKEMENSIRSDMKEMESSIRSDMKEMNNSIHSLESSMLAAIRVGHKDLELRMFKNISKLGLQMTGLLIAFGGMLFAGLVALQYYFK
jgi:predicted phage-related endonuclease